MTSASALPRRSRGRGARRDPFVARTSALGKLAKGGWGKVGEKDVWEVRGRPKDAAKCPKLFHTLLQAEAFTGKAEALSHEPAPWVQSKLSHPSGQHKTLLDALYQAL